MSPRLGSERLGRLTLAALSAAGFICTLAPRGAPHVIPNIIARNHHVGLLTHLLALKSQSCQDIRIFLPPQEEYKFPVRLFWHKKFTHDAGNLWLRTLLCEICREQLEEGCLV